MSNFRDLWGGFVIMLACCLMGIVMALTGGVVLDHMHNFFDGMGWFDEYADNGWAMNWGNYNMANNLYYGLCFLFPLIGIACFIKTLIARQGYDQYTWE